MIRVSKVETELRRYRNNNIYSKQLQNICCSAVSVVSVKICKSFHALIMGYERLSVGLEKGRRNVFGNASFLNIHVAPFDITSKAERTR